jgi:hypothetical protein
MNRLFAGAALWLLFFALSGAGLLIYSLISEPAQKRQPGQKAELASARIRRDEIKEKLEKLKEEVAKKTSLAVAAHDENVLMNAKTAELKKAEQAQLSLPSPKTTLNKAEAISLYKSATVELPGRKPYAGFYYLIEDQFFLITVNRPTNMGAWLESDVLHRDTATGIVIMKAPMGKTKPADAARWISQNRAEPRIGDAIYSVGSKEFSSREYSLVDGSVSTESRHVLDRKFFQTSLPEARSMPGAPVFNAEGKLLGVQAGNFNDVERVALAISSTELAAAIARFRPPASVNGSTTVAQLSYKPRADNRPSIQAAKARLYSDGVLSLQADISAKPTFEDGLFSGANDKLIIWNRKDGIFAYSIDSTEPVWSQPMAEPFILQCPQGSTWALRMSVRTPPAQIDLGTGKALKTYQRISILGGGSTYYPYGHEYLVTEGDSIWFFDPQSTMIAYAGMAGAWVIGRNGDTFYFYSPLGKLGYFNAEAVYKLSQKPFTIRLTVDKDVFAEMNVFDAPGVSLPPLSEATCHVIPGTDHVICGKVVWEVGADGVRRLGELPALTHSKANEDWFYGLYSYTKSGQPDTNVIAVSNSGEYALTQTHLIDLKSLKIVLELPFPARRLGFLSSEKHIYLLNSATGKVMIYSIEELRKSQQPPR